MVAGMNAQAVPTPPELGPRPVRLLSADEVAAWFGVPRTFVYAFARRELPTVHVAERYVRSRPEAVEWWITAEELGGLGSYR
jgi:hypothetical protein